MKTSGNTGSAIKQTIGCATALIFFAVFFARGQDLDSWIWRYPLPQGNRLNNVVAASNRFVAVGNSGTILTSADGISWINRISAIPNNLGILWHGPDRFETIGTGTPGLLGSPAPILTSPLGVTWTSRLGIDSNFTSVVSSSNHFIALSGGSYYSSTNGTSWSGPYNLGTGIGGMFCLAYGNGLFVTAGNNGQIAMMPDDFVGPQGTWSLQASPTDILVFGACYGNGQFFLAAQGYILASPDGVNWSNVYTANGGHALGSITVGSNICVAVGGSQVVTSQDGVNWTETNIAGASLISVAYSNGKFVAVGDKGIIVQSLDGFNWSQISSQLFPTWKAAAYGQSNLVTLADGISMAISANGSTAFGQLSMSNINKTIYVNGQYIAAGTFGNIAASVDGLVWTNVPSGVTASLFDIASGGEQIIVVGDAGTILDSNDGLHWHAQQPMTTNRLSTAFYAEGMFNAIGAKGTLLRSADSSNWVMTPFTGAINSTYGNGVWVELLHNQPVFAGGTTLLSSTNGLQWTLRYTNNSASSAITPLLFANGNFFALYANGINPGGFASSTNGIDWVSHALPTANAIGAMAPSRETFAVVGAGGAVLETGHLSEILPGRLSEPRFVGNHTFQMSLTGETDERYRAQFSSDLHLWADLNPLNPAIFGNGTNGVVVTDTNATSPNNAYRVLLYP